MSVYPKRLVSPDGAVAMVNDAADEATLRELGFTEAAPGSLTEDEIETSELIGEAFGELKQKRGKGRRTKG